jgi:hypothetical protein
MSERVPGVSGEVERRILDLAQHSPPQMRLGTRLALASAVVVGTTIVTVLAHPRPDLRHVPVTALAVSTGAVLAIALASLLGVSWSRRSTGPSVRTLRLVALGTAPLLALVTASRPLTTADGPTSLSSGIIDALACLATMGAASGVGLLALLIAFRRAVSVAPHLRGAALGAAAGAFGGLAMQLRCPSPDPVHILAGHVVPIAIIATIGALVGPRVVRT